MRSATFSVSVFKIGYTLAFPALLAFGCGAGRASPAVADASGCPAGTQASVVSDVYAEMVSCERPDGTRHGPASIRFGGRLEGTFREGVPVGHWVQWSQNGSELGRYLLRAGNGIERRWHDDGTLEWEGELVAGKRHGRWIYHDAEGVRDMVEVWEHGQRVSSTGAHWISEIDEVDECGPDPEAEDGCPEEPLGER